MKRKAILGALAIFVAFGCVPLSEAWSAADPAFRTTALPQSPPPGPIRLIPGLQSLTFWERTGGPAPIANTFSVSSQQLETRLTTLDFANRDFTGASLEFYDVFYSNADGALNRDGAFVTVEAVWNFAQPTGGGLNIAEVQLNFAPPTPLVFGNTVASFVGLGDNFDPASVPNAVDGNLQTHSTMGNTVGQSQRLRITIGFSSASPSCEYSIWPPTRVVDMEGGTGSFEVTSATGCNWTATSNDSWITVTSGSTGSGNGTVSYSVAENTGNLRTGTISVATQTFSVFQRSCVLDYTPKSQIFPPQGGSGSLTVTTTSNCDWTAVSAESWITVTSGAGGIGNRSVTYSVAPHMGAVRTGRILIGGHLFIVTQEGAANCAFSITPTEQFVPNDPRVPDTRFSVTVTGSEECTWTARSNDSWITPVFGDGVFTGNQTREYECSFNRGPARTGTISIAGNTLTVRQERCPFTLDPARKEFSFVEQSGSVQALGTCDLTAVSNAPWITITSIRPQVVNYRVAENRGASRTGTITIVDRTFEVFQFAQGVCAIFGDRSSDTFYASGGDHGRINVTAPPNCGWSAQVSASWITITPAARSGDGVVEYSVAPNTTGNPRSASIEIKDDALALRQTVVVNQRGPLPPCVQSISPQLVNLDGTASTAEVVVTAPPDCTWDAIIHAPWINSVTTVSTGSGFFRYSVPSNPGGVRSSVIEIGGKTHSVTQNVGECPVEMICQLFPSQCEQESQARSFRNEVLARTPRGQRYTELYYKLSTEAVGLMVSNPSLILWSRDILQRYKPLLSAMLKGERVVLNTGDLDEIERFLNSFAERGSSQFNETLKRLGKDLRDPTIQSEFNLIINEGPMRELPADGSSHIGLMYAPFGLILLCRGIKLARRKIVRSATRRAVYVVVSLSVVCQPLAELDTQTVSRTTMQSDRPARRAATFSRLPLPLRFEANQGQISPKVNFFARGPRYNVFLAATETLLATESPATEALTMKLIGANGNAQVFGRDEMRTNYFIGGNPSKWQSNAPTYGSVKYDGVYRGVDLVYYGNRGDLEFDFIVAPEADPAQIELGFFGTDSLEIDAQGDLVVHTRTGEFRQRKPVAYQEIDNERKQVGCRFTVHDQVACFELDDYDTRLPLVIDPVLVYSTYLGGAGTDEASSIAVDQSGNAYLTGLTSSLNFPSLGSETGFGGGQQDAFIVKLDPSGTRVIYSTYIGGDGQENGTSIALDALGNAYVTGFTSSTNFPVKNALQQTKGGNFDAFVVKLSPSGSLISSTLLGGSSDDFGSTVAVDQSGFIFAAGITTSANFPIANALQPVYGGATDVFIAKIAPAADRLVSCTYLGGTGIDAATSIAVDPAGNLYVTGLTSSPEFRRVGPLQSSHRGGLFDAFAAKFGPSGNIVYSTFLGGSGEDRACRIAADSEGNAYITGDTDSTDFPTSSAVQKSNRGGSDAFALKISPTGDRLLFSTYLGGSNLDGGSAIAADAAGSAYVTGFTASTDFPTINPMQPSLGGGYDGFIAKLSSSGTILHYSTYMGGSGTDSVFGVATDRFNDSYVIGITDSTNLFTQSALQPGYGGGTADLFVAKIKAAALSISRAEIQGKHLLVFGSGFDEGARIVLDGVVQKTINDAQNPTGALFGKKVGKKIAPGQTVMLQIRNTDGTLSNLFSFTRI